MNNTQREFTFMHTPGPWYWVANDKPINISTYKAPGYYDNAELRSAEDGEGILVCDEYDIIGGATANERIANARLIAAVPELLEECQQLLVMVEEMLPKVDHCQWGDIEVERARAAIAKATGASQ